LSPGRGLMFPGALVTDVHHVKLREALRKL
jgi:hypothetical protein